MSGLNFQHESVELVYHVVVLARIQLVGKLNLDTRNFVVDCKDLVQLLLLDCHVCLFCKFLNQTALFRVQILDLLFDELHEI